MAELLDPTSADVRNIVGLPLTPADNTVLQYDTASGKWEGNALSALGLVHTDISDFDAGVQTNRLDQMAAPTASVDLNTQKIIGLLDPTLDQDAATKKYVDDNISPNTLVGLTDTTITSRAANEVLVVNSGNTAWVNALLFDVNISGSAAIAGSKINMAITQLSDVTAKTGSGTTVVFNTSPTIVTPTIASFVNATHTHLNAAGGGTLTKAAISDFAHQASHQSGGGDGLTGLLDATARTSVSKNSAADVGARRTLNFIEGSNITLTIADDSGGEEVDITITSTAGGGSPLTTKGDIFGFDSADARIPVGANNLVLMADSGETLGLKYALVVNANIAAAAAIDYSKLATLTSGNILVGSAGNVATSVAMSGDVAIIASGATTIQAESVNFAKMQNITTARLLGRQTAATGDIEEISLNATLELVATTTLQRAALTGDVTAGAGSNTTVVASVPDGALSANVVLETITNVYGAFLQNFAAATLRLPNSDTASVSADGDIAFDNLVTDFSTGILRVFGSGEEQGIVSMPIVQFTTPTNGDVVSYNAANDEFELVPQTGGAGEANLIASLGGGTVLTAAVSKSGVTLQTVSIATTAPVAHAVATDLMTFSLNGDKSEFDTALSDDNFGFLGATQSWTGDNTFLTTADGDIPRVEFFNDDPTPTNFMTVGEWIFYADHSGGGAKQEYGRFLFKADNVTDGSEEGAFAIELTNGGAEGFEVFNITVAGSPSANFILDDLSVTKSASGVPDVHFTLFGNDLIPADSTLLSTLQFQGKTDVTTVQYATLALTTGDVTDASSSGILDIGVRDDNAIVVYIKLDGEGQTIDLLLPVDFSSQAALNLNLDADNSTITNIGSTEIKSEMITGQATVTAASGDFVLISDTGDSGNLKKVDANDFLGGSGDMVLASAQTSTGKKTFTTDATNAGLAITVVSTDPSALAAGDIWINDTGNDSIKYETAAGTFTLPALESANVFTQPNSFQSHLDISEIATPSNPATNIARLYAIDNGGITQMEFRDSAGTSTPFQRTTIFVVAANGANAKSKAMADFVCDGTNDEVQIQAAIDALTSGGEIHLSEGTFNIAAQININESSTTIRGAGNGTKLNNVTDLTSNIFVITDSGVNLHNLNFSASSVKTEGSYILINTGSSGCKISYCVMDNGFKGINILDGGNHMISEIQMKSFSTLSGARFIIVDTNDSNLWLSNCELANSNGNCDGGIELRQCSGVWMNNVNVFKGGTALIIDPVTATNAREVHIMNCSFDTSDNRGVNLTNANGGTPTRIYFNNCFVSNNTSEGFRLDGTDGVIFTNGTIRQNSTKGVLIEGGAVDTVISGNIISGNSVASSGTSDGILVEANQNSFTIIGNMIGPFQGASDTQRDGIRIDSGSSDDYIISNNNLSGNVAALTDNGTGTNKTIIGNIGDANVTNSFTSDIDMNSNNITELPGTFVSALSTVTGISGDFVMISDTSDSGNLKKVDVADFLAGSGDMILADAQTSTGKKTFTTDATNAGLAITTVTANPSALVNGDIWIRSDLNTLQYESSGAVQIVAALDNANVFTVNQKIATTGSIPVLLLDRPEVVADDTIIGRIAFTGFDDLSATQAYARIEGRVIDDINTNTEGALDFFVVTGSAPVIFMTIDGAGSGNISIRPNDTEVFNVQPTKSILQQPLFMLERASAVADVATFGQFWVQTLTPNAAMFTDDTGIDFAISGYKSITYTFNEGGSVLTTGIKGTLTVDFNCEVVEWVVIATGASGAIVIDVERSTFAGFPTTASIAGTELPTISATNDTGEDRALTSWSDINAGDVIEFHIDSVTAITVCSVTLKVRPKGG